MSYLENLEWRYATKRMNGNKIPKEKLENILKAIQLSPSSIGLMPYSVIVVEDPEIKKKLLPAANNQPQMLESSAVLVFAYWSTIDEARLAAHVDFVKAERNMTDEAAAGFKQRTSGILKRSPEDLAQWAAKQAYIALGFGLAAAALEKVDATPMEGFKPDEVDAILGLKEKGLRSVLLMPLGYRDEANDPLVKLKKIRREANELFIRL
jgi:nitroreductase